MTETTIEDFTRRATEFLDANAERRSETKFVWGEGSDSVSMLDEKTPEQEQAEVEEGKAWKQKEFDAGFGWISGPTEYGGQGLPGSYDRAYRELVGQYAIPSQSPFGIGLGMVAPTILAHAIPEVRERYLRPLWRGEIIGCQLFSEPVAGSDLAGIQTKAERDGDEWIITGQKVWTSGAQYSDIGEIITRTSPDKPKHKGLSMFLVDMHAPGVEVRPLRQMTGGASFNEVFFTDLRVPDDHRLGDVNGGWSVALTTLLNERASIGAGSGGGMGGIGNSTRLIAMLRHFGLDGDAVFRQELAKVYAGFQVAKWNNQRAMDKIKAGQAPGPEMSLSKMSLTNNMLQTAKLVSQVLGPKLVADSGEWGTYSWGQYVVGLPGMRIAGGADEVLRNIVGERVLGLPKDAGIDSKSPFKDLKVGTQRS
jgi:alkylation response protein AidB-like acyl-CoA dehydrogenase